jgi:hypothetical protein
MHWWMANSPTLRETAKGLEDERVVHAQTIVAKAPPTKLFVSTSGSWSYGGPDSALEVLEAFVAADAGHTAKLGAAGVPERHLWLWTDYGTVGALRAAFEEHRLPARPPQLPAQVTDLWCVDEVHRRGWRWDGTTWSWVSV